MALAHAVEAVHQMEEDAQDPPLEGLRHLYKTLEIPGHKVEILEGRLVVSASPIKLHSRIVMWLGFALQTICADRGWDVLADGTIDLKATEEWVEPDLFVCPRNESTDTEWLLQASDVLLAVEVVSPSSRRTDYEVKARSCALSKIPCYLVIDPRKSMFSLFHDPSPEGYLTTRSVHVGGKLQLPEPFGITLDTGTSPLKPRP